jgi:hypothetical protein
LSWNLVHLLIIDTAGTIHVVWGVALCRCVSSSSSSSSIGDGSSGGNVSSSSISKKLRRLTLKMQSLISFVISRTIRPVTRHHIPEDSNVQLHRFENLSTVKIMVFTEATACGLTAENLRVGGTRYHHLHRRSPLLYPEDGGSGSVYQTKRLYSSDGRNHNCSTYPHPIVNYPPAKLS